MDDLIAALQILRKYGNPRNPFVCEHDTLYVVGIVPSMVTAEDVEELKRLGFFVSNDPELCFKSYRFGSA
jgi:hypothetical protein